MRLFTCFYILSVYRNEECKLQFHIIDNESVNPFMFGSFKLEGLS